MTRIRIYTESKLNLPGIVALYYDGATLTTGLGLWRGEQESSTVIEVLTDEVDTAKAYRLAEDIKRVNSQSAVLVTVEEVKGMLI